MSVPAVTAPGIYYLVVREIHTYTSPANAATPTDGQFQVNYLEVKWDGYNSAKAFIGQFSSLLNVDQAAAINPAITAATFGQFAQSERTLLHQIIKSTENLVNLT